MFGASLGRVAAVGTVVFDELAVGLEGHGVVEVAGVEKLRQFVVGLAVAVEVEGRVHFDGLHREGFAREGGRFVATAGGSFVAVFLARRRAAQ